MYETVQTSRKYEQIVEQIMNLVADGTPNIGDQLPAERELAQQFGVSRTAVREAVKALRERGLVQIHPGRGTYISDYSLSASGIVQDSLAFMVRADDPTGPDELQQVRYLLEPAIAALAAEKATPQNLELLQILIDTSEFIHQDFFRFVDIIYIGIVSIAFVCQDFHPAVLVVTHSIA
jgi:GntR family transcriptional repressor for pyruvate dehydrogenase complex